MINDLHAWRVNFVRPKMNDPIDKRLLVAVLFVNQHIIHQLDIALNEFGPTN